ncbi:MAG: hypothetical protein H0U05_06980 [Actinobacteria bacterium]|jgi:DNA polymerase III alpha subunit|nr:hypothetical protein [Actinomycetota bacterium]
MDEARAVLERLERIEALDRAGAERAELLPELRALLEEAEWWSSAEGGDAGEAAVDNLRTALARATPKLPSHDMIAV